VKIKIPLNPPLLKGDFKPPPEKGGGIFLNGEKKEYAFPLTLTLSPIGGEEIKLELLNTTINT
jgi:hypothetical protein